jgi:hypothetical protein
VENSKGKSSLRRQKRTWEVNINIDMQVVGCGDMYSIEVAQDRDRLRTVVNAVMNLYSIKIFEFLE